MKIGFIGAGNMGGAILKGYVRGVAGAQVWAVDRDADKMEALVRDYGVKPAGSVAELVQQCDIVLLCIKPQGFADMLPEAASVWTPEKTVVTIAAGISIAYLEEYFGSEARIVRIMPNTPALVGEAMIAVCRNRNVDEQTFSAVLEILTAVGKAQEVPEELIHCVIGVSGSSPAYTYMYIDALAQAAVKNGMSREQAILFAAQSVLGAAKMVLETEESPEQLCIRVCSPGGTTIEAVNRLKDEDFAGVVERGFQAAVEKSKVMTK